MVESLEKNFQIKFKNDFILLPQQRVSRLRMTVDDEPDFLEGKYGYFDRIGAVSSQLQTTRDGDSPIIRAEHSRRRIIRKTYEWGDLINRRDLRRLMKNPQNKYVKNAKMSWGRDIDDAIIAAASGNAESIDENDSATNVALPSGQKVAVASAGLTLAKLLSAKEILDAAEVDDADMGERVVVVTSKQVTNLLNTTEVKNADYNSVKALVEGRIDTFLGFKFIRTERLQVDSGSDRLVLAYTRSAIGLAADLTPLTRMAEDPSKKFQNRLYMEWEIAATRVIDEGVVEIACEET